MVCNSWTVIYKKKITLENEAIISFCGEMCFEKKRVRIDFNSFEKSTDNL